MVSSCSYIISACVIASSLVVAGCEEPPESVSHAEKPVARSVGKQSDAHRVKAVDQPKPDQPDAPVKNPEVRKPLDLSMPPQPKVDLGALEGKRPSTAQLLPDLFEQDKESGQDSLHLKGRVLMGQTGQENTDSIEGGQIIIEMKTR